MDSAIRSRAAARAGEVALISPSRTATFSFGEGAVASSSSSRLKVFCPAARRRCSSHLDGRRDWTVPECSQLSAIQARPSCCCCCCCGTSGSRVLASPSRGRSGLQGRQGVRVLLPGCCRSNTECNLSCSSGGGGDRMARRALRVGFLQHQALESALRDC